MLYCMTCLHLYHLFVEQVSPQARLRAAVEQTGFCDFVPHPHHLIAFLIRNDRSANSQGLPGVNYHGLCPTFMSQEHTLKIVLYTIF